MFKTGKSLPTFSLGRILQAVSQRSGAGLSKAVYLVRVGFEILNEAVSTGVIDDMRLQLRQDYQCIFESGAASRMT